MEVIRLLKRFAKNWLGKINISGISNKLKILLLVAGLLLLKLYMNQPPKIPKIPIS